MRRAQPQGIETAGQDSFLDVVTNIVGILIILVMVVGVRAGRAPVIPKVVTAPATDLSAPRATSDSIERDVLEIAAQKAAIQRELAIRMNEKERLTNLIAAGAAELDLQQAEVDEKTRAQWDIQTALASARGELDESLRQVSLVRNTEGPTVQIESYPTPIGKTVYGKEAHFQLSQGRLTYVPFDQLLEKAKETLRRRNFTPEDLPETTIRIGPLEGFRLAVTMEGQLAGNRVQFALRKAQFIPVSRDLGETLDQALATQSQFRAALAGLDSREATVTIWFHPDSFAEFRELKKQLYMLGFATAAWPLPAGTYISASPNGTRSAAQ